jgi:peptidoglycan hydrolase-like protein with peptidoglycan-binding domain
MSLKTKLFGFVAGFALFAAALIPATNALTVDQLKALGLTDAQAQAVAAIFAGSTPTTTPVVSTTFTRDLTIGSTGADVVALQDILISGGHLVMPAGVSKGYFGTLTQQALAKMQMANGITPAAGYFGPITRAKVNSMVTVTPPTTPGTPGTPSTGLQGGAGSITVDVSSKYSNEDVGEGQEDVPVLAFDIEADDESDVQITSVKVEFSQNTGADSDKLDDYVDEVTVWFDGKQVGSSDADDFNESSDVYSRNISLSNVVIEAGEEEELVIAVSALSNLDSSDIDTDQWNVGVSSIRFMDGDGVVTTDSFTLDVTDGVADDAIEKLFDFEDFSGSADLEIKISLEDDSINDARIIEVDATADTNGEEILSFTIEAEGDSDIWIDEIPVEFTVTEGDLHDMVATVYLFADGDEIASETVTDGLDADETITFEDLDYTIDAGDEVEFVVVVDLKSIADGIAAGDTIQAQITGTERALIDAEDESGESVATGDMTGTAIGEAHAMYAVGIMVDNVTVKTVNVTTSDTAGIDETATFEFEFDVSAFGGIAYIDDACIEDNDGTYTNGTGVNYSVTNDADNSTVCTLTTSADAGTGNYIVDENDTETFTLAITATASVASDFVQATLRMINWSDTNGAGDEQYTFNLADYKTSSVFINNR